MFNTGRKPWPTHGATSRPTWVKFRPKWAKNAFRPTLGRTSRPKAGPELAIRGATFGRTPSEFGKAGVAWLRARENVISGAWDTRGRQRERAATRAARRIGTIAAERLYRVAQRIGHKLATKCYCRCICPPRDARKEKTIAARRAGCRVLVYPQAFGAFGGAFAPSGWRALPGNLHGGSIMSSSSSMSSNKYLCGIPIARSMPCRCKRVADMSRRSDRASFVGVCFRRSSSLSSLGERPMPFLSTFSHVQTCRLSNPDFRRTRKFVFEEAREYQSELRLTAACRKDRCSSEIVTGDSVSQRFRPRASSFGL